jgi:hypothetical protein
MGPQTCDGFERLDFGCLKTRSHNWSWRVLTALFVQSRLDVFWRKTWKYRDYRGGRGRDKIAALSKPFHHSTSKLLIGIPVLDISFSQLKSDRR